MSFILDKQTANDLNIFNSKNKQSVYALFNRTRTKGGSILLEEIFKYPLNDPASINARMNKIQAFSALSSKFPFEIELIDAAEQYLSNTDSRSQLGYEKQGMIESFKTFVSADTERQLLIKGINAIVTLYGKFSSYVEKIGTAYSSAELQTTLKSIKSLVETGGEQRKPLYDHYVSLDKQLRFVQYKIIKNMLFHIYSIDVFIAIAKVAMEKGYTFPVISTKKESRIILTAVYHPLIENAITNNLLVDSDSNIIFLTGANMAGKSTFMKTFGIAVFLAHIGFPVPAAYMEFVVIDGLYTSINLPDNLHNGYSHFYTEVMRIKKIAEELRDQKRLLVIFDELFRGTNVKDAYDATVAITASIAMKTNCIFLVSTHIMEAAEKLKSFPNINFVYLPTKMQDNHPVYTYRLEKGVSDDRHGMIIIQNEGILEILKKAAIKNKIKS
jgi:DNA mismatch repair protein MutS